eukprot:2351337-Amphidinium_carterae.1
MRLLRQAKILVTLRGSRKLSDNVRIQCIKNSKRHSVTGATDKAYHQAQWHVIDGHAQSGFAGAKARQKKQ